MCRIFDVYGLISCVLFGSFLLLLLFLLPTQFPPPNFQTADRVGTGGQPTADNTKSDIINHVTFLAQAAAPLLLFRFETKSKDKSVRKEAWVPLRDSVHPSCKPVSL